MNDEPIPRLAPDFAEVLGDHAAHLDDAASAAYGIWRDGRLAYFNKAWLEFAANNGGDEIQRSWNLGVSIWDAIHPPLREFYQEGFERCLEDGQPWCHSYQCSSPELLRKYQMTVYPLGGGRGLLIVNSLQVEVPHPDLSDGVLSLQDYLDEHGLVHQCMHCRRVRRADGSNWDWIPQLVASPPSNMTGALCGPCFLYHYPGAPSISP
ncbi:MAG: hypothetical protein AB1Z98_21620 [Nannocystaceae bacterium]